MPRLLAVLRSFVEIGLLVCVVNQWMLGQTPESAATTHPELSSRIAQAVRVDHAPHMDGTLDDLVWQQALAITDFKQREPYEGQPATERTEVRVIYTRNEVYFGVVCHVSATNGPVATQLRRDVTQELDDYFEIVIDSRFDRRNAYVFQINPLGTQRDALITDEQIQETQDGDPGWDGVWSSEARRTQDGWTATIAIPFSTLNFMRSRDVVWGLNFKRFIRRKNEEDLWSGWRRTFGASKISQAGEYADATFKTRPQFMGLRELQFEGFMFHAPDTHHVVQTQEWQTTFRADFHNGSYTDDDIVDVFAQRLTTPFNIYKSVNILVGVYNWTRHQLTYGSPQDRRWMVQLFERFGSYYDGRLNELRVRAGYRANERLSFSLGPQWNRFRLPIADGNFSVVVGALETDYAFSRFLSLSTILQVDTANVQGASANIRLRWNYRPDSDLYVIYTAGQKFASLAAANPAQFYENRFVVKYTYSFRP